MPLRVLGSAISGCKDIWQIPIGQCVRQRVASLTVDVDVQQSHVDTLLFE